MFEDIYQSILGELSVLSKSEDKDDAEIAKYLQSVIGNINSIEKRKLAETYHGYKEATKSDFRHQLKTRKNMKKIGNLNYVGHVRRKYYLHYLWHTNFFFSKPIIGNKQKLSDYKQIISNNKSKLTNLEKS
jgi:hypothetical protein